MPSKKEIQRSRYQQEVKRFLGKTEEEVLKIAGEPTTKEGEMWAYREELGPGAHSFRWYTYLHFKDGRVVSVSVTHKAIGCSSIE